MSWKVHGSYQRCLADLPVGERPVRIRLVLWRLRCTNERCPRRTFAAQVEDLTGRYGRCTLTLQRMLEVISVFLAGRPGARLARRLAVPVSRSSLLRLLNRLPLPTAEEPAEVGIDDFAFRRGHRYGTLVIDMGSHRPLEVLPDRGSQATADWLNEHAGISVICRDRAGAYAEAARIGAPQATQVADRWHLWHNLAETVEKIVRRHRSELQPDTITPTTEPATEPDPVSPSTEDADTVDDEPDEQDRHQDEQPHNDREPVAAQTESGAEMAMGRLATRTMERHASVHALMDAGRCLAAVSRELHLAPHTVRRFARAASPEDLLAADPQRRGSVLDDYTGYLHRRWNEGVTAADVLTREITELGYRGSIRTVRRYLQPVRETGLPAPPSVPTAPSVRQVAGWMTRRPEDVADTDTTALRDITNRCPALASTYDLVREFAKMLTQRHGERLGDWMDRVEREGEPELRGFATNLRRDLAAVTAGLTLTHSSGAVEGNVNRIKTIKRQMYGRAGFDLLRRRVLIPA